MNDNIERQIKKIESEIDLLRTIEVPSLGTGGTFVEGPDIDLVIAAGSVTIGRAGDSILLFRANGNPLSEFAATEAGLIAALAAAATGDIVQLPLVTITLTAPITIPAGVRAKGNSLASFDSPIIRATADVGTPLVTLDAGAMLEALEINYSGANNVAQRIAVWAGANTFIRQVWGYCTNAAGDGLGIYLQGVGAYASLAAGVASGGGAGIGRGILLSGASAYIYLCTGTGNGAAGSAGIEVRDTGLVWDCRGLSTGGWGLLVSTNGGASTSKAVGGIYTGSVADIRIDALCTLQAYGIQYATSSVVGTLTYLQGDRAAYSVEDYHAADIEASALTRHLPAPAAIGDMAIVNAASNWAILTDVAAGQPLLSGGVATIPKYAGWTLAATAGQTYTFPAAGGTVALLNAANSFTLINPLTTIAESWIGPSATTGIYFKDGKIGIGTIPPNPLYLFHVRAADGISDNSYVAYISNEEATANRSNGMWIHAGSSASDYNIRCDSTAGVALWSVTGSGLMTAITLNLSATSNQIVMQSAGVTGTLTWTPTVSNKVITLPDVTGTLPVGTGVVGRVAEWVTNANTLQAANLIAPVANILTLTATAASTLALAISAGKSITMTATDTSGITFTGACVLTIPVTGTVALLGTANAFTMPQTITSAAPQLTVAFDAGAFFTAGVAGVTGITTFDITGDATKKFVFTPPVEITGDLTLVGGDIIAKTETTWNVLNTVANTINFGGVCATLNLGAASCVINGAGGLTINGGIAANDDITIQGTSHATRTTSYVLLQPNGGNVLINTTVGVYSERLRVCGLTQDANQTVTTFSGANAAGQAKHLLFQLNALTPLWTIDTEATGADPALALAIGGVAYLTISNTGHVTPAGAGTHNLGDATNYWGDISYKTLTDQGCLGDFGGRVELADGSVVNELKALTQLRKRSDKKQTSHGIDMLDYSLFPRISYKPAPVATEDFETSDGRKFKRGSPAGDDGIEMTSVFSLMIGAFREISTRLDMLERIIK